jgi:hypothetical protein
MAMPNVIWQVGKSMDEKVAAESLKAKNNAVLVTTANVNSEFEKLKIGERLHIVADMSLVTGAASNMPPSQMAEFLVAFGLKSVSHISLVICNSAEKCLALGGKSFMEALREALISEAIAAKSSLYVGTISGRVGYVNVYNAALSKLDDYPLISEHYRNTGRSELDGSKYVFTEPTLKSSSNEFVPKGYNKKTTEGIAVEEGVNVGG